jgi:thioredoxin-like negative regulator of GroEL
MIFLPLLLHLSRSDYIELDSRNINDHIGASRPIFVKFYRSDCAKCKALIEVFSELATSFPNVTFAGVDCGLLPTVCEKYQVTRTPYLTIFKADSTVPIDFDGENSLEGLYGFVEDYTGFKPKRVLYNLAALTPANLDTLTAEKTCVLAIFYVTWCQHSKRFLPRARLAAASMAAESNVTIGKINCEKWNELCGRHDVRSFPTVKLYKNDTEIAFNAAKTERGIVDFLNANCGTEREVGGLLGPKVGLVEEAQPLVSEFLQATDKQAVVQKTSLVKGAQFYMTVMQRYIALGKAKCEEDLEKMAQIIDARQGSWATLDAMKKRYNIFVQFFPERAQAEKALEEDL